MTFWIVTIYKKNPGDLVAAFWMRTSTTVDFYYLGQRVVEHSDDSPRLHFVGLHSLRCAERG
jgi:hypothetical protein